MKLQFDVPDDLSGRFERQRRRCAASGQLMQKSGFGRFCANIGLALLEQESEITPEYLLTLLREANVVAPKLGRPAKAKL